MPPPLYAKQFFPCFVFGREGLVFNSELRSDLFLSKDTLLKKESKMNWGGG